MPSKLSTTPSAKPLSPCYGNTTRHRIRKDRMHGMQRENYRRGNEHAEALFTV